MEGKHVNLTQLREVVQCLKPDTENARPGCDKEDTKNYKEKQGSDANNRGSSIGAGGFTFGGSSLVSFGITKKEDDKKQVGGGGGFKFGGVVSGSFYSG